jgi:hypothetical protein
MEWMIAAMRGSLAEISAGVPIRERLAAMRGPRLRWWLWQVYAMSIGMTRAASRAVSRCDGDGMAHFGNFCGQAKSWMSTSESMASIVSVAAVRARGPTDVASSTVALVNGLIASADAGDEMRSAVAIGLVAELSMCSIMSAVDLAPADITGGISAGRSSYWTTTWPSDIARVVVRIDPDSDLGRRMSGVASGAIRLFEDVVSSWQELASPGGAP